MRRAAPAVVPAAPAVAAVASAGPGLFAWGANNWGQLGDGTTTDRAVPGPVGGLPADVRRVFLSDFGGFAAAVNGDGTVSAWGGNGHGQFGDGTTTGRDTPAVVPGLTGITQVAGGKLQMLFLGSDGTVFASGDNELGQLGDGTTTERHTPVVVSGLTGVTQIASGTYTGYALRSDGTVWAWGNNSYGELGDGATARSLVPEQVPGLTGITQVAAGDGDAFAIRSDGTLLAWGDSGQLGDGTTTNRLSRCRCRA